MERDLDGKVERYNTKLMVKGFIQMKGIDFKETYSPISYKDSFRIVMFLIAHFDLELCQIDIRTTFLNDNLEKVVYMEQPKRLLLVNKST